MSTIRQHCPACDRMLELPAEGVGRLGKCPACEATFTIGSQASDPPAPDVSLAGDTLDTQPTAGLPPSNQGSSTPPAPPTPAPPTPAPPTTVPPVGDPIGRSDRTPDILGDNPWEETPPAAPLAQDANSSSSPPTPGTPDNTPSALGDALAAVESDDASAWLEAPEESHAAVTSPEVVQSDAVQSEVVQAEVVQAAPSQINPLYHTNVADDPEADGANMTGHPFSAPLPAGTTDELPPGTYVPNTKTVTYTQATTISSTSIEGILSPTLSIFGERWPALIMTFMILVAVTGMLAFIPGLIISNIANAGGDTAAAVLTLIWLPLLTALAGVLTVGGARVAIAVARNSTPSPLADLIPPIPLVIRFFIGALVLSVCAGGLSLAVGGTFAVLASAANNQQISGLISLIFTLLMASGSALLHWLFWSWLFVVSDGKGTSLGSLRTALAITMSNKLTSVLLVLIMVVMSAVGTIMCGVGHILTAPFLLLMFAVAYLRMTGQSLDNPLERTT